MWILIKLTVGLIAFVIRLVAKFINPKGGNHKIVDEIGVYYTHHKNKHRIYATTFAIEFKCRSVFKLTKENSTDRFFKKMGLAKEIQTRDQKFDDHIYIASDSSAFMSEISLDAKTREWILDLFIKHNCQHITCDGRTLRLMFPEAQGENAKLIHECVRLYKQMSDLDKSWKGIFYDHFAWKAVIIECLIWTLAAYAFAGFMEWMVTKEDMHFDPWQVFGHGILWGALGAIALLLCIVIFLKGSSRGHRIIVESALILGFSLPVGGVNALGDINTQLDSSPSQNYVMNITNLYEVKHRRKRGYYYTYHVQVFPLSTDYDTRMPLSITVNNGTYRSLKKYGRVKIEVGEGKLHYPWFRSITAAD